MEYRVNRTILAGRRFEHGEIVPAETFGDDAARLEELGALSAVAADAAAGDELRAQIRDAIGALGADAFTAGGKPRVEAIEDALPGVAGRIDAGLRDEVWAAMEAEGATAPA